MTTMRAWVSEQPGHDNLILTQRSIPQPGPGQVLVKLKAASLNYRDTAVVGGRYPAPRLPAVVPCSDGCGEVIETGADVKRVAVGDRVAPLFFQDWISGPRKAEYVLTALGAGLDGCLQEYICLEEADRENNRSFSCRP